MLRMILKMLGKRVRGMIPVTRHPRFPVSTRCDVLEPIKMQEPPAIIATRGKLVTENRADAENLMVRLETFRREQDCGSETSNKLDKVGKEMKFGLGGDYSRGALGRNRKKIKNAPIKLCLRAR